MKLQNGTGFFKLVRQSSGTVFDGVSTVQFKNNYHHREISDPLRSPSSCQTYRPLIPKQDKSKEILIGLSQTVC